METPLLLQLKTASMETFQRNTDSLFLSLEVLLPQTHPVAPIRMTPLLRQRHQSPNTTNSLLNNLIKIHDYMHMLISSSCLLSINPCFLEDSCLSLSPQFPFYTLTTVSNKWICLHFFFLSNGRNIFHIVRWMELRRIIPFRFVINICTIDFDV